MKASAYHKNEANFLCEGTLHRQFYLSTAKITFRDSRIGAKEGTRSLRHQSASGRRERADASYPFACDERQIDDSSPIVPGPVARSWIFAVIALDRPGKKYRSFAEAAPEFAQ
jgi:hypothetical protein